MSTQNVYDTLTERGFIAQSTHPDKIRELLAKPGVPFYMGFDPTAPSLHLGHFLPIMVAMHLQRAGHIPILLIGGGTARIGDPSGKTELRKMLSEETIDTNVEALKKQMKRYVDTEQGRGFLENNADWYLEQSYLDFLREIGVCFSVNRMLTAECYRKRLEVGLTFLEFNYMLLQANDFYHLYRSHKCLLEIGGDDQWSNMLAGIDLIRRKESQEASAFTLRLLTNSQGVKMGKTVNGALWIDPELCPPFEFYQYLRNIDDADVISMLKLLTFVPMDEIAAYAKLEGSAINEAKKRLALETTAIVHGREIAENCAEQAKQLFEGAGRSDQMETLSLSAESLSTPILDTLVQHQFLPSKGEGRRLIQQGGLRLNDQVVSDFNRCWEAEDFSSGEAIIRKGKKHHLRVLLSN